jgi:hypothetical protein
VSKTQPIDIVTSAINESDAVVTGNKTVKRDAQKLQMFKREQINLQFRATNANTKTKQKRQNRSDKKKCHSD